MYINLSAIVLSLKSLVLQGPRILFWWNIETKPFYTFFISGNLYRLVSAIEVTKASFMLFHRRFFFLFMFLSYSFLLHPFLLFLSPYLNNWFNRPCIYCKTCPHPCLKRMTTPMIIANSCLNDILPKSNGFNENRWMNESLYNGCIITWILHQIILFSNN